MESRSQTQIVVFIALFVIVLVLVMLGVRPADQREGASSDSDPTAAILVVDAFEPLDGSILIEEAVEPEPLKGTYCIVTPEGEFHYVASGASNKAISGASNKAISGASNKAISGAAGSVILDPHGRLVYNQLQSLLWQQGGVLEDLQWGANIWPGDLWMRDMGRWDFPDGDVLLVGVDTEDYTTELIGPRIERAVQLLNTEFGIEQFVVNMSFVIVPCGAVGNAVDYAQFLRDNFSDLYDALNEAFAAGQDVADVLIQHADFPAFYQVAHSQRQGQLQETLSACYLPSGVIDAASQVQLETAVSQVDPTPSPYPTITAVPPSALDSRATDACQALLQGEDALSNSFSRLGGMRFPNGNAPQVIPIAAAGNRGDSYSFAPGYWPTVVSVGADYVQPPNGPEAECPTVPEYLDLASGRIFSNCGEVRMNGVYNGLTGSSFAAPRLSAEAALYLLAGGSTVCTDAASGVRLSAPPMAYTDVVGRDGVFDFLSLLRVDASRQHCPDFNALLVRP